MATTRRRYAPRLPPDERRRQVLDATLRLISRGGYAGVSMEAVAREVGVAKPVIYDLFANVGELLAALLDREEERALAQIDEVIPPTLPPDGDLQRVVIHAFIAFLQAVVANPEAWRLIVMPPEATPDVVREHVERGRSEVARQLEMPVAWGAGQLGLRDLDTELTAQGIVALGEHAARLVLTDSERYPPERFGRLVESLFAGLGRARRAG